MKNKQLNQVIRLINKTGDKVVVLDQETEEVMVLMPLEKYEEMVDVMDNDWQKEKDTFSPPNNTWYDSIGHDEKPIDEVSFGPVELPENEAEFGHIPDTVAPEAPNQGLNFDEDWSPVSGAEENLADVPHDDEEEEKFYLEPVE